MVSIGRLTRVGATAALALGIYGSASAATFIPTTHADGTDVTPGDGVCATSTGLCTLRAAIQEANALANVLLVPDTISVPAGVYKLKRTLGELVITEDVMINGGGLTTTRVIGNKPLATDAGHRLLHVASPAVATISNLSLRRSGPKTGCGGGLLVDGGATVNLTGVDISRTRAYGGGAGICNNGTLSMTGGSLVSNRQFNNTNGGGLNNSGTATLTNVTLRSNKGELGGGIYQGGGTLAVSNSTIYRNSSASGAGVYVDAASVSASLTNCTVSQNRATTAGGGIRGTATTTLLNVTVNSNSASNGGGIAGTGTGITNTILNKNRSPVSGTSFNNCETPTSVVSGGHNLENGSNCLLTGTADISGQNPLLRPLANNSGTTKTHALGAGSPAIDQGDDGAAPATDQRGFGRVGTSDIGSYEASSGATFTPTRTPTVTSTPTQTPTQTPTSTPTNTPVINKKVFVTSTLQDGNLGGLAGADGICAARALAASPTLIGSYKAWLSDSSTNAKDRINNANFYLVDGTTLVANSIADLTDGTLAHAIDHDESDVLIGSNPDVWTGTKADGTKAILNCTNWSVNTAVSGATGREAFATSIWTEDSTINCAGFLRLYCIEQ